MHVAQTAIPVPARWLGFGGLTPFVALALAAMIDTAHAERWADGVTAYGAVILSFVGALHWAFAMCAQPMTTPQQWRLMGWSVVPALGAWLALLLPQTVGLYLLCALFIAHYVRDCYIVRLIELPAWYLRLRTPLTIGVVVSLATTTFVIPG